MLNLYIDDSVLTLHLAHETHLIFSFVILLTTVLYLFFNNLFVSPPFSKLLPHVLKWSLDWRVGVLQKCNFGFFPSYPGDVVKEFRSAISDGGMERWSLFNWKYIYLLFKTLQWWVLYLSQIFFCLNMNKKFCLTRGTLSKNLAAKFWKNKLPLAMQLQKFHFLFLFSSQTRKLLE